ncbi:Nuclear pore glycoprotein p62 [Halotydeus destructor]|nr:Nuclear pore glycoprotein p62 [Halotydeus destructor]
MSGFFGFGQTPSGTNPTTSSTGFSFGQTSTVTPSATASTGFPSLGQQPATSAFSFGQPAAPAPSMAAPAATASSNFGFGQMFPSTTAPASGGGFSFGQSTNLTKPSTPATTGFPSIGQQPQAATGFPSIGQQPQATTGFPTIGQQSQATTGFSFGQTATPVASVPSFPSSTAAANPGFGQALSSSNPAPAGGGFSFGLSAPTTTSTASALGSASVPEKPLQQPAVGGFSFGPSPVVASQAAPVATAPSLVAPVTTVSSSSAFGQTTNVTAQAPLVTSVAPVPTTQPITTAAPGAVGLTSPQMTFRQLEDNINIWLNELQSLESDFHQQAQTVNVWDNKLVKNALKITEINETIDKLKSEQQKIDHQLDFIISQQSDLEQLLEPLENCRIDNTMSDTATAEREYTYNMVETVYNDLQGIGNDLQMFIKKLNENKATHDVSDPLAPINKVLNSHMDALHYVENQVQDLKQVLK